MMITMTDEEITALSQAVERLLMQWHIHLNTDRYNDLDDYLRSIIAGIEENGE